MPVITLPDGSQREFDNAVSIMDVATDIGPGLAKATLAGMVDGEMKDADKSEEALELIRHDAAHVMAQAVQELYPGTQVTIGPAIEDGLRARNLFMKRIWPRSKIACVKLSAVTCQ